MWRLLLLLWLGFGASALRAEEAGLRVALIEGDPVDFIRIENTLECGRAEGLLEIDMTGAAGRVVIDSLRGGVGSRDPEPVELLGGPGRLEPPEDGARRMRVWIEGLGPEEAITIKLDFDNERSFWEAGRVTVTGEDLRDTALRYVSEGVQSGEILAGNTVAVLALEDLPCEAPEEPAPVMTPIS